MMSETFESKNGIQPAVSEAKTEAAAGDDVTVRYIEGLLASNRRPDPSAISRMPMCGNMIRI